MLDIGIKIASALDMALKHDLLHRDIKPGNISVRLRTTNPSWWISGWRAAREADPESPSETHGTPYYVAPEKIRRERETFLSDMYSLGCTLYHALTGHVPFEAPTVEDLIAAHVHTPLTSAEPGEPGNHAAHERRAGEGDGQESRGSFSQLR